ncbi:MAG: SusD/RagB family nutrient-binding outer membrane lipoprotein [Sediminibacterium sp.]|nr:SusD/RagB family nutrient-binding outer membrane lipoprotein [Sediminibacterium sp.]MDP1812132.1 SusD/RagB family nutrient-binding outer membrane lipoprotein [Sediminibacterium sp.]MDP3127050.1 SusD/RagB family nutrient-binding outer membrane lipoprotein [Sediminibacterium sp.]MDP3667181.1 SusD/RagB family nutrient-binding outer membrane lipoprotein [Sediminibacterium sp.]
MKKFLIILIGQLCILSSCQKTAFRQDELLAKRDALESAEPNLLLSSIIQKSAFLYQNKSGMGATNLSATVQYMQGNRNSDDNTYLNFRLPKSDLYEYTGVIKLINAAVINVNAKGLKTHEGVFRIFQSLLWSVVTDLYGDIFYTEGLRGQDGILFPKFDEQKDIYPALIQNLKDAAQLLTDGKESLDKPSDIMFTGDKTKWIKLANSLRLRLLIRESNKVPNAAEILAVSALPLLSDVPDNAAIPYIDGDKSMASPMGRTNLDPAGNFLIVRPCKTLVDTLKALNDERLKVWVAPVEKPWAASMDSVTLNAGKRSITVKGYTYNYQWEYIDRNNAKIKTILPFIIDSMTTYTGYPAGVSVQVINANGSYDFADTRGNYKVSMFSKLFNENANPLLKATIMQADEVQFLLAEAVVKGWITGNAETFYKKGVELAMKRWGEPLPASYFTNPLAAFPADKTQQLAKIGLQKWLGLFMMGIESYADYRRTRVPFLENNGALSSTVNPFPLRYRYPESEFKNNSGNYQIAIGRLDKGDIEFSKMWLVQ